MKENQVYRDLGKDVIAAQNNDRDAQERIIVCVRDMIYYTCLKMLRSEDRAMDATQDITMTIYERLGTLKDPTAYVGWVRRITANYCKNALSAKNVDPSLPASAGGRSRTSLRYFTVFCRENQPFSEHL